MATKVFVSFDYDNDAQLKDLLIGQSRNSDSPFEVEDWSVKTASPTWRAEARSRISRSNQVIVLCGKSMRSATGVIVEMELARELGTPYFLLAGYTTGSSKPVSALSTDKLYTWSWENLKKLIAGQR